MVGIVPAPTHKVRTKKRKIDKHGTKKHVLGSSLVGILKSDPLPAQGKGTSLLMGPRYPVSPRQRVI